MGTYPTAASKTTVTGTLRWWRALAIFLLENDIWKTLERVQESRMSHLIWTMVNHISLKLSSCSGIKGHIPTLWTKETRIWVV